MKPSANQAHTAPPVAGLSPRDGRQLPDEYQPENLLRRTGEFANGPRERGFIELVAKIDTGPVHVGNGVEVFTEGREAFQAIHGALSAARKEILLETYILRDDSTGREMQECLAQASERGVTVRVLADGFGSWGTKRSFWSGMRRKGVQARLFHPFWGSMSDHFHRDHRKIIVIDQRFAFIGGMNIADEYGSSRKTRDALWRDTQVRLDGPVAWELAAVFQECWERAGGESFEVRPWNPPRVDGAECIVLDSVPGRGQREKSAVLTALVSACRQRLWITNAYFAPRPQAIRVLCAAARRGVDVRLLLPGRSDIPLVRHAGHGIYAELLTSGVRIFEYQPAILHEKSMVADGYVTIIGSSNLDFRSFEFNAECNVMIFEDSTAQKMATAFEEDQRHSVEIQAEVWKSRAVAHKVGDALARCLSPLL